MADRAKNNKVPTRNAPNSDQEPQRSRGPDDRPTPPPRDEMNRKTAPGRDSAAPSSPAPVANRITATESPTKKACNGLLQQNLHKADIPRQARDVRLRSRLGLSDRVRSAYDLTLVSVPPAVARIPCLRFQSTSNPRRPAEGRCRFAAFRRRGRLPLPVVLPC